MVIRIIIWSTLVLIVAWLFYMSIVPGGQITYVYNFQKPSEFILPLTPAERMESPANGEQKIIANPVYFSLRTPRTFDTARVTIKYKNQSQAPLVEAGVLVDKTVWNYKLEPLDNKILDNLSQSWNVIREGDLMLLERNNKFSSIEDFLNNLPAPEEIALYNYNLRGKFALTNQPQDSNRQGFNSWTTDLRGSWQIYTYVNSKENLDFKFNFIDLNKNQDSDPLTINLYYQGQLIDSRQLEDDGNSTDNGQVSEPRELGLKEAQLPAGVYKIELKCNDDIITQSILTPQDKLAFINRLWLADAELKDFSLYTDSRALTAQTINPGSLQEIKVGQDILNLNQTYQQFSLKLTNKITPLQIAKGDIILSGDGVFSLSQGSLINPEYRKVDNNFDADAEGINYILARYTPPIEEAGWQIATADFNLKTAYREFYKYGFLLSIPGLSEGSLEVDEIRVELQGRSLWEKLREVTSKGI